ncbi:AAA family ATPase [Kitasatospora acidiphila]|uniref:AAA family ATPase n=1 Tax=Kitasatospora acidiphila TaxID=2567942 RepID=UPI001E303CD1|nr:ATP-binding protein [Kitasatospora acidiphila]
MKTAPLAVLLVGITGSGKTVLAQALAERGPIRLSVDEEVHRLHGRYGVDYPEHEYFERERPRLPVGAAPQAVVEDDIANALTVTPEALNDFFARFEAPIENEDAVLYDGDPEAIVRVVDRLLSELSSERPESSGSTLNDVDPEGT